MAEYIEREAFIHRLMAQAVTDDLYGMGMKMGFEIAAELALRMPRKEFSAADVVEVKRGEWERVVPSKSAAKWSTKVCCSVCRMAGYTRYNFCPNCGADMREVGAND